MVSGYQDYKFSVIILVVIEILALLEELIYFGILLYSVTIVLLSGIWHGYNNTIVTLYNNIPKYIMSLKGIWYCYNNTIFIRSFLDPNHLIISLYRVI